MVLQSGLDVVEMTYGCPHCDHGHVRTGSWFRSVAKFVCVGCGTEVRLTYSLKTTLFAKYALPD